MAAPFTRVIIMGDTHCGSSSGLTPPSYDSEPGDPKSMEFALYDLRRWHWEQFSASIDKYGPFDICIANGDLIEGTQRRSNGNDLLNQDRLWQANMATQIIRKIGAEKNVFTLGTPYHVGDPEDFEQLVAEEFDAVAKKEVLVNANGVMIHATHHAPGSQNPNTRQNRLGVDAAIIRKRVYEGRLQKVDLFFRSHAHYSGTVRDGGLEGWRVPALQLVNTSKYGRAFAMDLDYGFLVCDIYGQGAFSVREILWMPPMKSTDLEHIADGALRERRKSVTELLSNPVPVPSRVPRGLW